MMNTFETVDKSHKALKSPVFLRTISLCTPNDNSGI